jgi:hypothetical protein
LEHVSRASAAVFEAMIARRAGSCRVLFRTVATALVICGEHEPVLSRVRKSGVAGIEKGGLE